MSTVLPQYPFDPTGLAATNKVVETQQIESRGMFDHYYIIPRSGPFYAETVKLRLYPAGANVNNPAGGQPLEEGVHYNFGYHFAHASHTIGLPVYGAITFYDRNLAGQLRMEFQTIGGEWVLDDQKYAELLLNVAYNPRIGTWEQVVELPHQFPVVNHDFNIDDFVGMSEVVDELSDIEQAILQKNAGGLADHVADKSNPHDVTKTQVGLGLVDNFPTATVGEAQAGVLNTRFMTPLRVKQLIDATATAALNGHMADMNNPHQTTKTQVGLGNVQNYAVATQAEAEAGASNARYMTPLRTREAIEAIVGVNLTAHINDKNNPHQTTKAQVGLGSVVNIGIATDAAAVSGVDDSGVITPRLLAMVLSQTVGSGMTDHVQNFNNPHSTTKAQVGLGSVQNYAVASEAEARAATASDRYMTPLAVRHAINELVGDSSNAHATDYNNPHRVTADQVGTYSEQEIDQLLADKIGLDDTAGNSSRIFGLNQPELQAWIATISSGNSYKFEQKTYAEVKADILTGTAADSMKLDGKTYQEIRADITAAVDGSNSRFEVPPIPAVDVNGVFDEPPLNWLKIGTYKQPLDYAYGDMTLLITGGRNEDSETDCHHTVLLEMSLTNDYPDPGYPDFMPILVRNARVKHLSAPLTDPIVIGYVIHQQAVAPYIDFYIKSEGQRAGWTINEFSRGYFTPAEFTVPDDSDDLILVEPAGIVYPTAVSDYSTEITQSQTHIARTDNPHGTTKAQVGLGSVQNYGTATPAQGVTGTATNLYMTPASTTAKVDNSIGILCDELIVVIDDAMVNLFA